MIFRIAHLHKCIGNAQPEFTGRCKSPAVPERIDSDCNRRYVWTGCVIPGRTLGRVWPLRPWRTPLKLWVVWSSWTWGWQWQQWWQWWQASSVQLPRRRLEVLWQYCNWAMSRCRTAVSSSHFFFAGLHACKQRKINTDY